MLRLFLYHYVFTVGTIALIDTALRLLGISESRFTLPAFSIVFIAGCLYSAYHLRDRLRIFVAADHIVGPANRQGDRIRISIDRIDRMKSTERTWILRLTGTHRIWSVDETYIQVRGDAFSERIRGEILMRAGLIG
jgi:hypothetical protein